jgi:hypothetical protein
MFEISTIRCIDFEVWNKKGIVKLGVGGKKAFFTQSEIREDLKYIKSK